VANKTETIEDLKIQTYAFKEREERRKHKSMNLNIARENLIILKGIFDQNNIKFWLCFGTLLGAVRDNEFIPYDTDTDICVYKEDLGKIVNVVPELEKMNLKLIRVIHEKNLITFMRNDEYIDIYVFVKRRKALILKEWRMGDTFKIKYKFFKKFAKIIFLNQTFLVPNKYEKLLEEFYGKDWRIPIRGVHATPNVKESFFHSFMLYRQKAIVSRFDESRINSLKKKTSSKIFAVFGAGSFGEETISLFNTYGIKVEMFLDNNPKKWGTKVRGIEVVNPEKIDKSIYIIIASTWNEEISIQLEKKGFKKRLDYIILN
jgi:hypothetical protein